MTNKNGPIQLRMVPAQAYVANFLATFKEYQPRMKKVRRSHGSYVRAI